MYLFPPRDLLLLLSIYEGKKKEMVIYHRQSENHSFEAQAFLTPRGLLLIVVQTHLEERWYEGSQDLWGFSARKVPLALFAPVTASSAWREQRGLEDGPEASVSASVGRLSPLAAWGRPRSISGADSALGKVPWS